MKSEWVQKRWFEFRHGYSGYFIFIMGFSNFALILYGLAPNIKDMVPFEIFIVLVTIVIIPTGILVGNFHIKHQYVTESAVQQEVNPYRDRILPKSKEVMEIQFRIFLLGWMKQNSKDEQTKIKIDKWVGWYEKILEGNMTTEVMNDE